MTLTDSAISFEGRVAVVTGAGGGLGRTYALELARRGASVVVNDLGTQSDGAGVDRSSAGRVVDEIAALGGKAIASTDSVATREGGEAIVNMALENFGRIDILINNAGFLRDRSFPKLSAAELDDILDVHLKGAFHTAQPAFRAMKEQGYGRLIFTTSAAGLFGNFGQANYAAAKMGVVGLSNALAVEGARSGITSNVIAPVAGTRLTDTLLAGGGDLSPEFVTPLVVFLVSEECRLTHEIFSVGGGRYAAVHIGTGTGWTATGSTPPAAEEIASVIDAITDPGALVMPKSVEEELALLPQPLRLGA
jgi:NAD(P)-dependent dehydrogenase (short-subunit alcohol dehydrogenase family)